MAGGFDPHLSEIVRRRFNIEGDSGPDDFSPSIQGVVLLDTPLMSPEYSYYAKQFRSICWGFQGAIAGQFTYAQIRNPDNSNMIVVVKRIWGSVEAVGFAPVAVYRQDAAVGVPEAVHCATDTRWGLPTRGSATTFAMGTAAAQSGTVHFTLPIKTPPFNATICAFDWQGDYVLSPGTGIVVWSNVVNIGVDINFEHIERMRTRWEI